MNYGNDALSFFCGWICRFCNAFLNEFLISRFSNAFVNERFHSVNVNRGGGFHQWTSFSFFGQRGYLLKDESHYGAVAHTTWQHKRLHMRTCLGNLVVKRINTPFCWPQRISWSSSSMGLERNVGPFYHLLGGAPTKTVVLGAWK